MTSELPVLVFITHLDRHPKTLEASWMSKHFQHCKFKVCLTHPCPPWCLILAVQGKCDKTERHLRSFLSNTVLYYFCEVLSTLRTKI